MTVIIGYTAGDFTAPAVMEDDQLEYSFNLSKYLDGQIGVLFFYPMNFSYICPTEVIALHNRIGEFKKRQVKVVGISTDTHLSHQTWRQQVAKQAGIAKIDFPLVADMNKDISRKYGVLVNESFPMRATFILDQQMVVRHIYASELTIGRNIDEILRQIDAIQSTQKDGNLCPANWVKGGEKLKPTAEDVEKFLKKNAGSL